MPARYQLMKSVLTKHVTDLEKNDWSVNENNSLPVAILQFGQNVTAEHVDFIPAQLTDCVVKGGEIPCVTYSGMCFSIKKIKEDMMAVIPNVITHKNLHRSSDGFQKKAFLHCRSTAGLPFLPWTLDTLLREEFSTDRPLTPHYTSTWVVVILPYHFISGLSSAGRIWCAWAYTS